MKAIKPLLSVAMVFLSVAAAPGAASVSEWTPIFQGIDQASGTNDASFAGTLSAHALRVDLHNPTIRLMVTPPVTNNYVPDSRETFLQTPREFVSEHGLQVAVNSGFFSPGGYNWPSGTPAYLQGLTISKGLLVSAQTSSNNCLSAILFTTNNQATFLPMNWPATNTAGIYNAVAGLYPLVSEGVNVAYDYTNSFWEELHQPQPHTAFGLSQDNRYLILMTIDGRQEFSAGALDHEAAELLLLFGAWNGMNLDGGGSTCMVKAYECGAPEDINHNSFQEAVLRPGSQRPVGCNFGVSALPLPGPIENVTVLPGMTTAIVTWQTDVEATTQVLYGPTAGYGSETPFDPRPVKFHVATLSGLVAGSNYYYRAVSIAGSEEFSQGCSFSTTNAVSSELVFPMTGSWRYSTNNLDGVDWQKPAYDDGDWFGPGDALLHIETSAIPAPKNTILPPGLGIAPIFRTYYFRTHFHFEGTTNGLSLLFSNYVDDGAIFNLNGAEMFRLRMPASGVNNASFSALPVTCGLGNDATCPDVVIRTGSLLTNLVQGDNLLAVEVHNYASGADFVFGSALITSRPGLFAPQLFIHAEAGQSTLYWNGEGFTLQQSTDLSSTNHWSDVFGPVTQSPFTTSSTNASATFFRLRN